MDNKLWWRMCGSAAIIFGLFCFGFYSLVTEHKTLGLELMTAVLVLSIVLAIIGYNYRTRMSNFWIVPFLGFLIAISIALEGNFLDVLSGNPFAKANDPSIPRYKLTRERCVERAIEKRKRLLAMLEG